LSRDTNTPHETPSPADNSDASKELRRKEYLAKYYEENKAEIAARRKAKRQANKEKVTAAERERYATDPAAREQRLKTNAKGRQTLKERIASDPEEKRKHEERLAKRRQRHQERLANDPEYRKQREKFTNDQRESYANDPTVREKRLETNVKAYHSKRGKQQEQEAPETQEKAGDEPT